MRDCSKWVLIKPVGGLCNRLRVIVSSLILAEYTGRGCQLFWMPKSSCNCLYTDLFEPNGLMDIVPLWYFKVARRLNILPFRKVRNKQGIVIDQNVLSEIKWIINIDEYDEFDYVYFKDCFSDFIPSQLSPDEYKEKISCYLRRLQPIVSTRNKLFDMPSQTIGVHIRRTDNYQAINVSTLEKFIYEMRKSLRENTATQFFLATDDPDVESHLKQIFPNKIIAYPKSGYDRNRKVAIQDALIDLLLLSRCEKILGSSYSSFSEYASLYNQIELNVVGSGIWKGPAHSIYHRE